MRNRRLSQAKGRAQAPVPLAGLNRGDQFVEGAHERVLKVWKPRKANPEGFGRSGVGFLDPGGNGLPSGMLARLGMNSQQHARAAGRVAHLKLVQKHRLHHCCCR